jgi:Domain of unknown function (DUF4145)
MSQAITLSQCNRCNRVTNHELLASESEKDAEDGDWFAVYEFLKCRGCGSFSLRCTEGRDENNLTSNSYPPQFTPTPLPDWLDPFAALFSEDGDGLVARSVCEIMREAYTARNSGGLRLCAMGIRAALEMVMIDKTGDHQNFTKNIDAFEKAGYLSGRQRSMIDSILEAGHAAIHRGWEPTKNDIETLFRIAESVIENVYLHEPRAERLEKAVPKRHKPKSI